MAKVRILNGRELVIETALACEIGLNEAIVLRQLYWRVCTYAEDKCQEKLFEGRYWMQATLPEMVTLHFPFWSERTLSRTLQQLRELGLILVRETAVGSKQGNYYTIDMAQVEALVGSHSRRSRMAKEGASQHQEEAVLEGQTDTPDKLSLVTDCHPSPLTNCHPKNGLTPDNLSPLPLTNCHPTFPYSRDSNTTTAGDSRVGVREETKSAVAAAEKEGLIRLMEQAGIDIVKATELVNADGADGENIRHQIAAMEYRDTRGLSNVAGYLVNCIRKQAPLPSAYQERVAMRKRREQQQQQAQDSGSSPPLRAMVGTEGEAKRAIAEIRESVGLGKRNIPEATKEEWCKRVEEMVGEGGLL